MLCVENYMSHPEYKEKIVNFGLQKTRVFEYEITDSTNTRAKLFAKNRPAEDKTPAIFFARAQSSGRGTRGRAFESPANAGAYVSILFYPSLCAEDSGKITAFSAVCVCRALRRLKLDTAKIKWINDINIDGKKLAGILTEGEIGEGGMLSYAIVGIGINTSDAEHSPEVAARMTSLEREGVSKSPFDLAMLICEELFLALNELGTDTVLNEYRVLSELLGRSAKIVCANGTFHETVVDIDSDYSLITVDKDGNRKSYISADVSASLFKNNN